MSQSKKGTNYYIAVITEIHKVVNVRYYKDNKLSGKFLHSEELICVLIREAIVFGTARQVHLKSRNYF